MNEGKLARSKTADMSFSRENSAGGSGKIAAGSYMCVEEETVCDGKSAADSTAIDDDLLANMNSACAVVLNILDDWRLYNKIEDGSISMNLSTIPVRPFFIQCIRLMEIEVCCCTI